MITIRKFSNHDDMRYVRLIVSCDAAKRAVTRIKSMSDWDWSTGYGWAHGETKGGDMISVTYDERDTSANEISVIAYAEHEGDDALDGTLPPPSVLGSAEIIRVAGVFRELIAA